MYCLRTAKSVQKEGQSKAKRTETETKATEHWAHSTKSGDLLGHKTLYFKIFTVISRNTGDKS